MENSSSSSSMISYETFGGLANWFGSNVSYAFFASLDRFSCVNVNTSDSDDDDEIEEEAKDRPLILTPSDHNPTSVDNLPV